MENANEEFSQKREALAAGYSASHRRVEVLSITSYVALETIILYRLAVNFSHGDFLLLVGGSILGFLGADFVSGFLHWAADSWGNVEWPFIGQSLIRTFREHHVDPKSITRHGFIETNGDICLFALPFLFFAVCLRISSPGAYFIESFLAFQCFWGSFTNQIHKWSHQNEVAPIVRALQTARLILPSRRHAIHHTKPFTTDYCITSGLLNGPLGTLRFFWVLEWIVHRITGAIPREDDMGHDAALALARARGIVD
ncbi:MAG: carotenoid synthesis regulator CarF [Deltaproteobacteria bacterium]|nr:carotenoid synthesis regulator CarF [Deltaproteobacteria bacterium]